MKRKSFDRLLSSLRALTPEQAEALTRSIEEMTAQDAMRTAIDTNARVAACPHCAAERKQKWGRTRTNAQRYRCLQCSRTFTGRTGSPISHVHQIELFFHALEDMFVSPVPTSIRKLARRLGVNKDTVWRWRQIILRSLGQSVGQMSGIVEVDETFVRESRKGSREWVNYHRNSLTSPKPERLRWYEYKLFGVSMKRGLSKWQLPVLTIVDRSGSGFAQRIPDRRDRTIYRCLSPIVCRDAALCSDGFRAYARFAQASGISHFVLGTTPGTRKIAQSFHLQNVNGLHSRLKEFLRPFKGPSTKYLDGYVNWFFARQATTPTQALGKLLEENAGSAEEPLSVA